MFKIKNISWGILLLVFSVFVFTFFIWPVFSLILMGLNVGEGFNFATLTNVLTKQRTWTVTTQTLIQAVSAAILSIILGIPAAFVLYRLHFPGRKILRAILTVPFVLPTVVVAAAFMALYGPGGYLNFLGLDRSFTVLLLALTFFNVTVVMRIVGGFWENLDPRQNEVARTLGASAFYAFLTVTLPNLKRAIISAGSLVFLFCASSFGVVFILGGRQFANIETEIYRTTMQLVDFKTAAVLALIQIFIVVLTLVFSSKLSVETKVSTVATDRKIFFSFRQHWQISLFFVVTIFLLHIMLIFALITRSLKNTQGQWSLINYRNLFTLESSSNIFDSIQKAIFISTIFALIATILALTLGLIVSLFATRNTQNRLLIRSQKVFEFSAMMPLGVSAVILGLGLLITMNKPLGFNFDLRTSLVLIPVAQTLIALPLVVRTLLPAVQRISMRVKEAATMLGASEWKIIFTIELPLIKNVIIVAAGFAFAASLGEFGAAAFLVRSGDKTLPVVIAQLLTNQDPANYGMGIAAAVLLGLITATVMVAAESLNLKNKTGLAAW